MIKKLAKKLHNKYRKRFWSQKINNKGVIEILEESPKLNIHEENYNIQYIPKYRNININNRKKYATLYK